MTIKDVIDNCENGIFPQVNYNGKAGRIVVIKQNTTCSGFCGVAVAFENAKYDEWFYEQPGDDKRKKYMKDLSFSKLKIVS